MYTLTELKQQINKNNLNIEVNDIAGELIITKPNINIKLRITHGEIGYNIYPSDSMNNKQNTNINGVVKYIENYFE